MLHARPMHIPLKLPCSTTSFIILLIPLAMRSKMRGDRGKPCHRSLLGLKKRDGSPLIKMAKDTKVIQLITQTINL